MSQTKAQLINAVDGSIVTADLADDAVTAAKLAHTSVTAGSYTTADITVDAQGRITAAASGTIANAEIADGAITNAKVNASAAIAGTKVAPAFGLQNITTSGTISSGNIGVAGTAPTISLTDINANDDFEIKVDGGLFEINDATNSANRFKINSNGVVTIGGNTDFGGGIDVTGVITGTSNLSVQGDITGTGDLTIDTNTLHVDSSNNRVGIGTSSPSFKFDVVGGTGRFLGTQNSGSKTCLILDNNGTGTTDAAIGFTSGGSSQKASIRAHVLGDGAMMFHTNNDTEKMRIDASGRVGIGTSSPARVLHSSAGTSDNCILATSAASNAFIGFADSGTTNQTGLSVRMGSSGDSLVFQTGGTNERLRIDSSGRLLIGTSTSRSPGTVNAHLQVEGTNSFTSSASLTRNSNDGGSASFIFNKSRGTSVGSDTVVQSGDTLGIIQFVGNDGTDSDTPAAWIVGKVDGTPGSNDMPGRIEFLTTADGASSPTERMRIRSSGNVGIGTTSPGHLLEVKSSAQNANDVITQIESAAVASGLSKTSLELHKGTGYGAQLSGFINQGSGSGFILSTLDDGTATERLRIESSGNVGIGTTSPSDKLHVRGASAAFTAFILDNATNSSSPYKITYGDQGQVNHLVVANRELTFGTNNAERVRIDSSGRVGIGTTSPSSALEVSRASGDTIFELNRSNSNVSGNVGCINFTASDGHSVGSIGMLGDGDDQGGDLVFRTTTAAADNSPFNAATPERMRIDSSGNVGIGTSSPTSKLEIRASSATHQLVSINREDSNTGALFLGCNSSDQAIIASNNADLLFGRDQSDSFTERMRLRNDGKLLINRTGVDGSGMLQVAVSGVGITTATGSQSSTTHLEFRNQSGTVGTIKTDGNNSSFNTSSDYRLKENVAAIADGIERLKQLKPKKFNWISDEKDTLLDGFLAHEVADVIPEAITGEKDAVDTDGKPIWQQIDHSKLVPLLVSAVQELIGKVEILEAA